DPRGRTIEAGIARPAVSGRGMPGAAIWRGAARAAFGSRYFCRDGEFSRSPGFAAAGRGCGGTFGGFTGGGPSAAVVVGAASQNRGFFQRLFKDIGGLRS